MTSSVDLTWIQAAALAVAFFAGGFVKGGIGFAFPLIIIAITSPFVAFDLTLALISVLQPIVNIFQFASGRRMGETLTRFWPMIAGLAIGAPIGALMFPLARHDILVLAIGLFIIFFIFWLLYRPDIRIPQRSERSIGGGAGILAGVLGTLTTINGPVFVTYLLGLGLDRQMMVTALGLFFLVSGVLIAGSFAAIGVLTVERMLIGLACAIPCALGFWAGNRAARHISADTFRKLVLATLFLLGVNMIIRTVLNL